MPRPLLPLRHRRFALAFAPLRAAAATTPRRKRSLALAECRLPNLPTAAQCGTLEVPEDREQARRPQDRDLRRGAARQHAVTQGRSAVDPGRRPGPGGVARSRRSPPRLTELRRTRDIVLDRPARHRPLVAARLRGVQAATTTTRSRSIPLPRAQACADELRAKGVDAAQYTTTAWIADLEAMREALGYAQLEPVGRQLRHARRAGISAPASGARAHRGARRRRAAGDDHHARRLAHARSGARRGARRVRAIAGVREGASRIRARRSTAIARAAGRRRPRRRRRSIRAPANASRVRMTFDLVIGALQPLHLRAGDSQRCCRRCSALAATRRLRAAVRRATHRDTRELAEQIERRAALLGHLRRGRAAHHAGRSSAAALADLPTRAPRRATRSRCATCGRGAPCPPTSRQPVKSDVPVLHLLRRAGSRHAAGQRRPRSRRRCPTAGTSSRRGYGHIVSPHACGPRLIAAFVDDAAFATAAGRRASTYFEKSVRPPLWPDRLAAAAMIGVDGPAEGVRQAARGAARCATCRSPRPTARSPACSAPTAPARRRCCACSRR